jgi:DNA-binding NarL/FixJ family response regulator
MPPDGADGLGSARRRRRGGAGSGPQVQKEPQGVIVILTRPQPVETFLSAMKTGVGGYLSVNLPPDEFISALRMLAKGDVVVSREVAGRLKEELSTPGRTTNPKTTSVTGNGRC